MKSHIPFRLNLLFFIIFLLFVILILRLGYMQIIQGGDYQAEVNNTESTMITGPVARGEMYDANLNKLVGNEAQNTITYTRGQTTSADEMANIAYDLASIISMPNETPFESEDSDLSERDMRDYYYAANTDLMQDRTEQYLEENPDVNSEDIAYEDSLDMITEEELQNFSERDKTAAAIFTEMNRAYALNTVNIKNQDVTQEEIARVSENLEFLPGIGTGTDWQRTYPEGDMLRSVLGNVSDQDQGLPQSELQTYLAKGYSRNDRVGLSFLEQHYEDVLRGTASRIETETNNEGEVVNQTVQYPGQKGDNLILGTDMDFQREMEQIAIDALGERKGLNNSIYLVAMDPNNGDLLGLTGKTVNEEGEIVDDALGVTSSAYTMGSSVKGATVAAGYMDGVISLDDNTITEQPLLFSGSESISSVFNRDGEIPVNDIEALQYSSNIYMATLAMRMGGKWSYQPYEPLVMNEQQAISKMRYYFEQFGLGSATGIDLPNEATGQEGTITNPAESLFFSFGQFDTYTPLQLAQYVSTIANDGVRIAPRFVSEIRGTDPETGGVGELKTEIPPKVMNTVDIQPEAMDRIQEGFHESLNGGYGVGNSFFGDAPYDAAGKTGTAEASYWGPQEDRRGESVYNMTFVAYAPYDNPEIAVAAVVPYLPDNTSTLTYASASRRVMDAYFNVGEFSEDGSGEAEEDNINELESENNENSNDEESDSAESTEESGGSENSGDGGSSEDSENNENTEATENTDQENEENNNEGSEETEDGA